MLLPFLVQMTIRLLRPLSGTRSAFLNLGIDAQVTDDYDFSSQSRAGDVSLEISRSLLA